MPVPTPELGLLKGVDADDTADYLVTSLANSLTTVDSLFNNVSGHTHAGAHQGGPIAIVPPTGSITSAMIADGTITGTDMAPGAAVQNVGALGGALMGFLPNPQIAGNATITSPTITNPVINGNPSGSPSFGAWTAWTPTCSQGSATPLETVNYATYVQIGKVVFVSVYITFNGAGAAGNDIIITTLPVPPRLPAQFMTIGAFSYLRSAIGTYVGSVLAATAPDLKFLSSASTGGGLLGNTGGPSFAVGANDTLSFTLMYEGQ